MSQLNFPVATVAGQTFTGDNGVIYTYVGTPPNGYWSGTFQNDGLVTLDARYVEKAGDNMTGNLTLGTGDKIELKAGDGSALFDGNVGIGTDAPGQKLEISGNTAITGGGQLLMDNLSRIQWGGNDSAYIAGQDGASGYLSLGAGGDRIRIQNNGYVGIGTDNPKQELEVNGTIISTPVTFTANQDEPYLIAGTAGWTGATTNWNTYGFQHRIKTTSAGIPRVTIDNQNGEVFCVNNNGNVGIGQTNPQAKLDVNGDVTISRPSDFWSINSFYDIGGQGNLSTQGSFSVDLTSNGYRNTSGTWTSLAINDYTGASQIRVDPTGYIGFYTDGIKETGSSVLPSLRMYISSAGDVGIGRGEPQARLSIEKGDTDNGVFPDQDVLELLSNRRTLKFEHLAEGTPTNTEWESYKYRIASYVDGGSNLHEWIDFGVGPASKGISLNSQFNTSTLVATEGKVGIGTDDPIQRLSVDSANRLWNVNDDGVANYVTTSATSTAGSPVFYRQVANRFHFGTEVDGSNDLVLIDNDGKVGIGTAGPAEKLSVLGNGLFSGTVSASGSILTSDRKFKTNIEPAGSQLSDVVQLGNLLKNWDWKEDAPINDKSSRFLGLIAQEAEEVSPGIVANIGEGEDAYKGVKNDVLVMKLLGAVAELSAEVEELKSQLNK